MIFFSTLDLLVFAFLVLSGVFAWRQGFAKQARTIIKWLGIGLAPPYFYLGIEPAIKAYVENQSMTKILAGVISVVIAWLVMSYTTKMWKEKSTQNNLIEQIGAVCLGIVRMFLVLYLLWLPVNTFWDENSYPKALEESKFEMASLMMSKWLSLILPEQQTPQQYLLDIEKLWQ